MTEPLKPTIVIFAAFANALITLFVWLLHYYMAIAFPFWLVTAQAGYTLAHFVFAWLLTMHQASHPIKPEEQ